MAQLRVQQASALARIHQLRLVQLELRREIQEKQLHVARLRCPDTIRSRIDRLPLQLCAPGWELDSRDQAYALVGSR